MGTYHLKSIAYRRRRPLAGLLLWLLYCLPVGYAQESEDFDLWSNLAEALGLLTDMEYQVEDADEKELLVRLGIIGGLAPEYRGSDEYELSYAPNIHIVWKDTLFLRGRKLGIQLLNKEHVYGGVFTRYTGGRSDNNEGLEGLGDISRTFTSGGYLNFRYHGIRLKTEVRHDFFDEGHGTLAIFRLGSRIPWRDPFFYIGVQTTWASSEYMQTFFGINTFQSMQSGLPQYSPGSGLRDVSFSLSSAYEFNRHWSITAQLSYQHLLGDAADSPLVRDIGSADSFIIGAGLNYTF